MRFATTLAGSALLVMSLTAARPAAAKTTEITFQPGTLVEAVFFRITPGQESALEERYLSKAFPLAAEYGMTPLSTFAVTHIDHGPDDAAMWGLFQWPNLDAKKRFEQDRKFKKLRPVRDSMLDSIKIVYLEPQEAVTVTLHEDRMYEFAGTWVNRTNAPHLQQYFAAAGPFVQENGVKFLGDFKVVGSPPEYEFLPQGAFFIEWPSREVKEKWFASPEFKSVGWHRALALDQLYVVESKLVPKP